MNAFRIAMLLAAAALLHGGCSKEESRVPAVTYSIDSVRDLTLRRVTSFTMPVSVTLAGGAAEELSLSFDSTGFPRGLSTSIEPASGLPGFVSKISFFAGKNMDIGTYPLKLVGRGKDGILVVKRFSLTVRHEDCGQDFTGTVWEGSLLCARSGGGGSFTSLAEPVSTAGAISISNFANYGVMVSADLNCDKGTITIPAMTYNNTFSLGGAGTFTDKVMRLRIQYSDATTTDTCTVVYTR